jgi:protein SCO1
MRTYYKLIVRVGLSVLIIAGCSNNSSLPYYNTPDFTPVWHIDNIKNIHTIPSFSFTNQNNEVITNKTFDNKIYVAGFFFTGCGAVCPKMTNNLLKVQQAFGNCKNIAFLLHSVTPWIDSIPRLKAYAKRYHLNNQWQLVTGDRATIYHLARQSYFAEKEPGFEKDSTEFLHTEHLLLIDKNKNIRGIYNGTLELEADRLISDIKTLASFEN